MVAIAECRREFKQTVIPVFYDVNPSDVREQSEVLGCSFHSNTKKVRYDPNYDPKVDQLQKVMLELCNLAGFVVKDK
jgi:hypothetical protein